MEKWIFSNFIFVQFLVVKDTLNRMTKHDGVIGFMLFKITGGMAKIKVPSSEFYCPLIYYFIYQVFQ